ncbi:RNA polymerase-associated factor [Dermatophagoides farinae]|uniref:RNA polymerase II-associated factor 1 homolog n=1 Tax=Dermatophagoides farinae TaxID=6954 RepID=A0A922L143_DERFA|nr:RNA polymerase-associated factor [Dermatophagoides farinae]
MAPVVQIPATNGNKTASQTTSDRSSLTTTTTTTATKKPIERRPELFCKVKYSNSLPDIPFDPKFIVYPFDTNRFVEYKQTSLEKNYKHDLLTEQDLGVTIDLINPETYEIDEYKNLRLAEEDEKLLEDEIAAPQDTKRSRCHNRAITWLKKTEYISTEFNRYGASSDKTETKVGFGVRKRMRDENFYLDRDSQIAAINKTFESAKKPILSHPGKPGLKPVKTWPVFPDFELWKYPFAQVMFDADPAPSEKEKEMSQAMIRGVMDESGEQFVAYFLPTEDSMNKRKIDELEGRDYTENEDYEYSMAREYNWNVKNKATKGYEENYFFVWRDDAVCYNELETRVKLSKRRVKHTATNSKLVVKHRQLNEQEYKIQEIRMTQLEPPQEEDEAAAAAAAAATKSEMMEYNEDDDNDDQQQSEQQQQDQEMDEEDEDEDDDGGHKRKSRNKKNRNESDDEESAQSSSSSSSSASSSAASSSESSSESSDESDNENRKQQKPSSPKEKDLQKKKQQQQQESRAASSADSSVESSDNSDSDNDGGSGVSSDSDSDDEDDDRRQRTKANFWFRFRLITKKTTTT